MLAGFRPLGWRRSVIDQAEAMSAIAGSDRDNWRDGVGLFGTGTPLAADVGIYRVANVAPWVGFFGIRQLARRFDCLP
jgi:hypothetical protein